MIISHKNKYIFIELPRTGTTAISKELVELYDGESILSKHSTFRDLKKYYPEIARTYFIFSCIRNPVDRVVSTYEKCKNGYYDFLLDPKSKKAKRFYNKYYLLPRLRYIREQKKSFPEFFRRFYYFPYSDWSVLDHHKFDFIIRFENLNSDFKKALKEMGINAVRDLPVVNKTKEKSKNYEQYFTEEIGKRTGFVFGPHMKIWNYELPATCKQEIQLLSFFMYRTVNLFRKMYWIYIKS